MTELVHAESARIDVDGAPLVEGLSFAVEGARVGLVGSWRALFALLAGQARLRSGSVTLLGVAAQKAVADGLAGVAALDPPLSKDWTVERYLECGSRLAGFSRKDCKKETLSVLGTIGLAHLQTRRIGTLTLAEQRALAIAQALLGGPQVLAVEDPFVTLDERGTLLLADVIERGAQNRALVISTTLAPSSGPLRAILDRAESIVVLERGAIVGRGPAAAVLTADARYVVSVAKNGEKLVERLEKLGLTVQASPSPTRFLVQLPEVSATRAILDASLEAEAPVIELRPLSLGPSR